MLLRDVTSRWDFDLFSEDDERDFRMSRSELERFRETVGVLGAPRDDTGRREEESLDEDRSRRDDASHRSEPRREVSRLDEVGRDSDSRREEVGRDWESRR